MNHTVSIVPSAQRLLESLPRQIQARIRTKIDSLAEQPRPAGSVKLSGSKNSYRIRVGDYRVVYEVHDDRRVVIIFIIGHRRDVYRRPLIG